MNPNYTARVKHPYAQSVEGLFTLSAMLLLQSVSLLLNVYKSPSSELGVVSKEVSEVLSSCDGE